MLHPPESGELSSPEWTVQRARSPEDVAAALDIRTRVFVREQGIPLEADQDGLDAEAEHVLIRVAGAAVATGRLVLHGDAAVAGRIAVLPDHRGRGLGRVVVRALEAIAAERGAAFVSLHPHPHLERFYQSLGYEHAEGTHTVGAHRLITMRRQLSP